MTYRFAIEPLSKGHDRSEFTCGNDRIDAYFRQTVSQDVKRDYATCFVASELTTGTIAGFYTLSSSNVPLTDIPEPLARKLPRYPTVPAVLIGWLARHRDFAAPISAPSCSSTRSRQLPLRRSARMRYSLTPSTMVLWAFTPALDSFP